MFNGKAIYNPSGKADEYARWACNLHVGCSNDCDYCYCKRGVLGSAMGAPRATLKKCFKNENDAFEVFIKELRKNADAIRKEGGLFFSFSTDPCLPETVDLTMNCVMLATGMNIPCSILTKCTEWMNDTALIDALNTVKDKVAFGFTLTGMDSMEKGPTVSPNEDRVKAMQLLHNAGFKTFASIEPVVDIDASQRMIHASVEACNLFKIGLMSGKKDYDWDELNHFVLNTNAILAEREVPVFWKKSVSAILGYAPKGLTVVNETYNLFKH